jgi:hypothetical protein
MRVTLLIALCISLTVPAAAQAQTPSRFQVGGQFTTLRIGDPGTVNAGLGGRMSFDLRPWVSVEGEFDFFPSDKLEIDSRFLADLRLSHERRRVEAFFGPKIGRRTERFGLFGAVKPGFSHLINRGVGCEGPDCPFVLVALPVYRTEFAMSLGGVFEVYPTARTVARVDVGDTLIRHRSFAPPCDDCSTHNLSTRFGFGLRF